MLNSNGFVKITDRFIGTFSSIDDNNVDELRIASRHSTQGDSRPQSRPMSPGSSVATDFKEEYNTVIKNAVIIPTYDVDPKLQSKITQRNDFQYIDKNTTNVLSINEKNNLENNNTGALISYNYHNMANYNYNENTDNENDIHRMKRLLSEWTDGLNSKILDQFKVFIFESEERLKLQVLATKEKCNEDSKSMQMEMIRMRQMLDNYNQLNDKKENIIKKLSDAVSESHTRLQKQKVFSEWRLKMVDSKREAFTNNLARQHFKRVILQKVIFAWRSLIQNNWKAKVEKACQLKSQEVCLKLNREYESKIQALREELKHSERYIEEMRLNRDVYESTVKKAIIRGVAALNTETMSVLDKDAEIQDQQAFYEDQNAHSNVNLDLLCSEHLKLHMMSINPKTKRSYDKYVPSTKNLIGKVSSNRQVISTNNLNLPNNILIERHKPFDKEICGNVVLTKCPLCKLANTKQPAIVNKRHQASRAPLSSIHTIRVVE